jgi:hypothetical protein
MRGKKWLLIVDGQEGREYAGFIGRPCFDDSKLIRAVAVRHDEFFNRELLRVEVEIVDEI